MSNECVDRWLATAEPFERIHGVNRAAFFKNTAAKTFASWLVENARVFESSGKFACTQPVFVSNK